jgi:hypothetical protein
VLGGCALVIAAISLLIPSTPSYDPWAWLVWGRQIIHLDLQTTGGPTWKPLPVIFTTLFAPFGSAAPDLWLVLARTGALMAVALVFKVAFRLTRTITGVGAGAVARVEALGPPVLAGLIAAISLALSAGFLSDGALGYSEGLLTAAVLIAVDRHLDGSYRQAFAVGFVAALDRPEIWLFWGPYGLWLWRKDPDARRLVLCLFVLIPILWFLPEYWGSGHFLRGVNRAQQPRSNSAAFAKCPFCSELVRHAWPAVLLRIKIAAAIVVGVSGTILWRAMRTRGRRSLEGAREHALASVAGAGALGLAWWVLIAILTQAGFSGNDRYLVLGAALIEIAGGVAFGWAAMAVGSVLRRRLPEGSGARAGAWSGVTALAVCFMLIPNWVGNNLINIPRTHAALVYQAWLREDAARAVALLGRNKVLSCGEVMTEGFQVPMLAWQLTVPTLRITASPLNDAAPGPAPNVIFQTRAQRHRHLLPRVGDWPSTPYREIAQVRTFRIYANCAGNLTL